MKPNPFNILCGGFTFLLALALFGLRGALLSLPSSAALAADAITPLGLLNFLVLQWFGVRLARVYAQQIDNERVVNAFVVPGGGISIGSNVRVGKTITIGWRWMRWIWPLTGWWTDYRWIARRS